MGKIIAHAWPYAPQENEVLCGTNYIEKRDQFLQEDDFNRKVKGRAHCNYNTHTK